MRARGLDTRMELRVIEKEPTMISIEIAGESHTFMNVLKGALLETEGITAATYDVNPEQSGGQTDPVLTIKTDEQTDALDALEAGAERVIEKSNDFTDAFETAA
jgi:DNA-directed RNA polymerase subunit L